MVLRACTFLIVKVQCSAEKLFTVVPWHQSLVFICYILIKSPLLETNGTIWVFLENAVLHLGFYKLADCVIFCFPQLARTECSADWRSFVSDFGHIEQLWFLPLSFQECCEALHTHFSLGCPQICYSFKLFSVKAVSKLLKLGLDACIGRWEDLFSRKNVLNDLSLS